jgi:putative transposase
MATLELKYYAHKVGVNVHHLEWCTKYRYKMFRQLKYKNLCEEFLHEIAQRHKMIIRELFVMPEHIHINVECLPSISQSKALQLLKGNLSFKLFRANENFRLRYPQGHFFSPGAFASSVGYNTVEVVDDYIKNQMDVHQTSLERFTGSPAL